MEKNSISKRIDNKHDQTNKIPQSDYKNDERSTEKAHKHVEVYKEESGKSVKLENLFKERSDDIPYTENLKKPSRSLKLKQRKLIRTPDIFITDKIFETKSNSMLLLTTQTLPQSTMSSSFSQHMAIASDISLTNFKKNYVEKAQTEELLTSKNNTNDLIFDYSYDKSTTTSTTKPTVPLKTQITSKALDGKSFTSNQVNSTLSDSVNRITPIVKCSNVLLNVDNNQSDTVSAFSEATSNISSSDLGSGNFNSITGTISTGSYYSDDHEFSILSNLNIDSEISDISIHSSSQNGHEQPQYYQQQPSHSIHHELVSTSTAQYNNSQKQLVTITSSPNAETNAAAKDKSGFVYNNDDNSSPMHLADYDDPLGSDLSTSASTKVTSTNTSFSGESFTGGSIEAPSSPVQRYQNFVFKSNDSIKSFETQTSPQLPIPPPVPRRSFQMQFEKVKSFETTVPSPIAQCTTPLNLPRNQSPDKNLPAHGNICRKTSPNNPFLPEIFKNRYATDRELDENVLFSNAFKEGFQSSEKSNVVDDSKLNESSTFPNVLSTLLTHENTMSKLTGSQSCHCKLENNLISSSNEYKTMITLCNSPVENKNLYAKEASYNTKSTKSYSNMSTKFSPQSKSKRNLNPFSKHCHESLPVSKNLNLKREEFLKATMRICLVVSPPSAKLHVKSKSLSHLDTLTYQVDSKPGNIISTDQPVVSSSEYFSVHFNKENDCVEEELIQVKKGITLLEAIDSALKRRNLRASQINITDGYIYSGTEKGSPPYACSIDENIDTANLPGRILIVREKNDSYLKSSKAGGLQKAASFGSRTRPSRLLSSASTEETSSEPDPKAIPAKQLKQRWSGLFGVKNPQQNQLCELLSKFSKSGGPPKKYNIKLEHQTCETDALKYLKNSHKCWREFIYYENLPDNEIKIQSAIWELVTTEIDYINTLQTVTDLFLACLEAIQEENILADVDQNKLFSNIREICESNIKFWASYLFPMVANSISNGSPLQIDYFEQGFVTFGSVFSSYKVYCAEQSTCQFYCKDLNRTNTVFTTYLAWCESQKNCNRLRLADILVRPMQRLTKYSLLLIAIRKHIVIENDGEMLDSMIRSVENFVYSVNNHLSTRQENERLKGIMARIESYDVVETNNEQLEKFVKQYSQMFDLCAPMKGCSSQHCRHLFMEGDLKLKDSASKSDVHCFLLTDILLICKTISKKNQGTLKVIRQPYFTDRLVIKYKDNSLHCIYLNEFQVPTSAFSLQCSEAKNWHDGITKAKHIYTRLKQNIQLDINLRGYNQSTSDDNVNILCVRKSPLNSSKGSRISSLNNSHSGSVELNDSKNISIDFEKANSLSSDESTHFNNQHTIQKTKSSTTVDTQKQKTATANTLSVEPLHSLGQSLPNLTSPHNQVSNNTLLVPEYGRGCSKNNLLSSNHRGISYPPPSPTRATLRRGLAFSSTIKNPPLLKSRNITSQNSVNSCQGLLLKTENKVMQHQQDGSSHFPDLSSFASSDSKVSSNPTQKTNPNSNTSAVTPRNSTLNLAQSPNETNV